MREGQASQTASQNALFRALEARRPVPDRICDDPLATHFLGTKFRLLADLARVPLLRRSLEVLIDQRWPCVRAGVVARTRLIDETILELLPHVQQVLILGAGFDSRPYRLTAMQTMPVFEVDHPATQAAKQRVASRSGRRTGHVTFVPVMFGSDDPADRLAGAGFKPGTATLVLWEGVTNYLDTDAVSATFAFLSSTIGAGSPVLFTYVDERMLDGSVQFAGAETTMRAVDKVGEPLTFGFVPDQLPGYLDQHGFTIQWDQPVSDVAERLYPPGRCPSAPAYYHIVSATRT